MILLDTRSNKDARRPRQTYNPFSSSGSSGGSSEPLYFKTDGDFLGDEQWTWLFDELLEAYRYDLIILGTSIQLLRGDGVVEESWSEFGFRREQLLRYLAIVNSYTDVLILSGDVHHAEVSQAKCVEYSQQAKSVSFHAGVPATASCKPLVTVGKPTSTAAQASVTDFNQDSTTNSIGSRRDRQMSNESFVACTESPRDRRTLWEFTSSGMTHTVCIDCFLNNNPTSITAATATITSTPSLILLVTPLLFLRAVS